MRLIRRTRGQSRTGFPSGQPDPQRDLAEGVERIRRGIADSATSRRRLALEADALHAAVARLQQSSEIDAMANASHHAQAAQAAQAAQEAIAAQLATISRHDKMLADQEDQLIMAYGQLRSQLDELWRLRAAGTPGPYRTPGPHRTPEPS